VGWGGLWRGGVQTEWCTVPKPRVDEDHNTAKTREGTGRERMEETEREKSGYFTPMQHAEEIQLPLKLHECN